jgi:hypothetical protein
VISRVDERLRKEAQELALRFGCEHCAHFAEETESCVHGYPNEAHLAVSLSTSDRVTFCKEFELA